MGTGILSRSLTALSLAFALAATPIIADAQFIPARGAQTKTAIDQNSVEGRAHIEALQRPSGYRHPSLASNSRENVGVALVLLIDVSASIDSADYQAQVTSMAEAIGSDDFRDAIFLQGSPESIAISVVDYGSSVSLRIPWMDIRKGDDDKLKTLARMIQNLPRRESGSTNQADAIDFARIAIENLPWEADRKVVDIITDGKHNTGGVAEDVLKESREKLASAGGTLNGLIIIDGSEQEQKKWSEDNLRTLKSQESDDGHIVDEGFVIVVATNNSTDNPGALIRYMDEMIKAFKNKLRMETSQLDIDDFGPERSPLNEGKEETQYAALGTNTAPPRARMG